MPCEACLTTISNTVPGQSRSIFQRPHLFTINSCTAEAKWVWLPRPNKTRPCSYDAGRARPIPGVPGRHRAYSADARIVLLGFHNLQLEERTHVQHACSHVWSGPVRFLEMPLIIYFANCNGYRFVSL